MCSAGLFGIVRSKGTQGGADLRAVVKKFDEHFTPSFNVINERAVFHLRQQQPDESVEAYVQVLCKLSEQAAFDNKNDAVRDRLVVRLRDKELSEKIQLQAKLSLKDAIQQAKQHEQVKKEIKEQRHDVINAVCQGAGGRGRGHDDGNFGGGRGAGRGLPDRGGATNRGGAASGGGAEGGPSCSRCGRIYSLREV